MIRIFNIKILLFYSCLINLIQLFGVKQESPKQTPRDRILTRSRTKKLFLKNKVPKKQKPKKNPTKETKNYTIILDIQNSGKNIEEIQQHINDHVNNMYDS